VGYKVQPIPIPSSMAIHNKINKQATKYNQKLKLFKRGNNISGQPTHKGSQ